MCDKIEICVKFFYISLEFLIHSVFFMSITHYTCFYWHRKFILECVVLVEKKLNRQTALPNWA